MLPAMPACQGASHSIPTFPGRRLRSLLPTPNTFYLEHLHTLEECHHPYPTLLGAGANMPAQERNFWGRAWSLTPGLFSAYMATTLPQTVYAMYMNILYSSPLLWAFGGCCALGKRWWENRQVVIAKPAIITPCTEPPACLETCCPGGRLDHPLLTCPYPRHCIGDMPVPLWGGLQPSPTATPGDLPHACP